MTDNTRIHNEKIATQTVFLIVSTTIYNYPYMEDSIGRSMMIPNVFASEDEALAHIEYTGDLFGGDREYMTITYTVLPYAPIPF